MPHNFPPDEAPTLPLVPCLECRGAYKGETLHTQYGTVTAYCPWCTAGQMTAEQMANWSARRNGRGQNL